MEKLKPCPFCGKPVRALEEKSPDGTVTWVHIMHGPTEPCGISMLVDQKDAVNKWNTRTGWLDPKEHPLVIWKEATIDELEDNIIEFGDLVGEFTPNGRGEFIAAIWVLSPEGDYWSTLKCRLNDEDASLEEFDGLEFVPCGWDLDNIDYYFPIPELPPLPLSQTNLK